MGSYRYLHTPLLLARFNDFSGGEYGAIGGRHARPNQFTGLNVIPYRDGSIGPRAGACVLTPSPAPTGGVTDIGWTVPSTTPVYIGTNADWGRVWWVDRATSANVRYGVIDATPGGSNHLAGGSFVAIAYGGSPIGATGGFVSHYNAYSDHTYIVSTGAAGLNRIEHNNNNIVNVTGPTGYAISRFGDRGVIAGIVGNQNRVRFSAANDFTSWPTSNFIDDFSASAITDLVAQRDHLLVISSDMTHHIITGTLGVNDSVREGTNWSETVAGYGYNTPGDDFHHVNRTHAGDAWGLTYVDRHPIHYNGTAVQILDHIFVGQNTPGVQYVDPCHMVASRGPNDFVLIGGVDQSVNYSLMAAAFIRGAWSLHRFANPLGANTWPNVVNACQGPGGAVIWADKSGSTFGLWAPTNLQPPGTVGNDDLLTKEFYPETDWPGVGNNATFESYFTTAEVYDTRGYEWVGRHVDVRFTSYSRGNGSVSSFDVKLNTLDVKDGVNASVLAGAGTSPSWTETHTASLGTTYRRRVVFDFPEARGGGLSVTFDNLKGVKIDDVLVMGTLPEDARVV